MPRPTPRPRPEPRGPGGRPRPDRPIQDQRPRPPFKQPRRLEGAQVVKVEITINNKLKFVRHAAIVSEDGQRRARYKLDDGSVINFNRNQTIKDLVRQMLQRQ